MIIISDIQKYIKKPNIEVQKLRTHSKANEKYVDVSFTYKNQKKWNGSIPYNYRRTGLFLNSSQKIAELIEKVYEELKKENSKKWIKNERKKWDIEYKKKRIEYKKNKRHFSQN